MTRERWFYAQGAQRRGPVLFDQLVDWVLGQPEPRAVLVWRKGFADWTRAENVPDVERRMLPFFARKAPGAAARRAPASAAPVARRVRVEQAHPGSPLLAYGGIAAGVAVLALLAWLFWPRAEPPAPAPTALPLGGANVESAPAVVIPPRPSETPVAAATAPPPPPVTRPAATPTPTPAPAARVERESDLPAGDLKRLRGVATWAGDGLKLTVYNGTQWRVTELSVKISRFKDDDFVEDPRPVLLVPPGLSVQAGVADLPNRVAPDRKKASLNPADTGPFECKVGPQPENFRWEIESARGYSPR